MIEIVIRCRSAIVCFRMFLGTGPSRWSRQRYAALRFARDLPPTSCHLRFRCRSGRENNFLIQDQKRIFGASFQCRKFAVNSLLSPRKISFFYDSLVALLESFLPKSRTEEHQGHPPPGRKGEGATNPLEIAFQSNFGSSRVLAALAFYKSPPSLDSPIILPSQEHRPPPLVFAQWTTILRGLGSYMPLRFLSSPGRQAQWKGLLIGGCRFETPKGLLEDGGCL